MASFVKNIWGRCAVTASAYGFDQITRNRRTPADETPPVTLPLLFSLLDTTTTTMETFPLIHVRRNDIRATHTPNLVNVGNRRKVAVFDRSALPTLEKRKKIESYLWSLTYGEFSRIPEDGPTFYYYLNSGYYHYGPCVVRSKNDSGVTTPFIDAIPDSSPDFHHKCRLQHEFSILQGHNCDIEDKVTALRDRLQAYSWDEAISDECDDTTCGWWIGNDIPPLPWQSDEDICKLIQDIVSDCDKAYLQAERFVAMHSEDLVSKYVDRDIALCDRSRENPSVYPRGLNKEQHECRVKHLMLIQKRLVELRNMIEEYRRGVDV